MRKAIAGCLLLSLAGCTVPLGTGAGGSTATFVPVPLPLPVPVPVTILGASIVPLDGDWVITDTHGGRSCIVIQESRVSILNTTCSNDGSGFASRIDDAPVIARTGNTIILTLTYHPFSFDDTQFKLTFVGNLQGDLTFVGQRTDQNLTTGARDNSPISIAATLARQ